MSTQHLNSTEANHTNTTTMATSHDGSQTGFLDLPPELRNEIYHLAFEDCKTWISSIPSYRGLLNHVSSTKAANILRTNNQIRSEATLLFYSISRFDATSEEALVAWLKHLKPASRAALKHVRMRCFMSRVEGSFPAILEFERKDRGRELVVRLIDAGIAFDGFKVAIEIWGYPGGEKMWPNGNTKGC